MRPSSTSARVWLPFILCSDTVALFFSYSLVFSFTFNTRLLVNVCINVRILFIRLTCFQQKPVVVGSSLVLIFFVFPFSSLHSSTLFLLLSLLLSSCQSIVDVSVYMCVCARRTNQKENVSTERAKSGKRLVLSSQLFFSFSLSLSFSYSLGSGHTLRLCISLFFSPLHLPSILARPSLLFVLFHRYIFSDAKAHTNTSYIEQCSYLQLGFDVYGNCATILRRFSGEYEPKTGENIYKFRHRTTK